MWGGLFCGFLVFVFFVFVFFGGIVLGGGLLWSRWGFCALFGWERSGNALGRFFSVLFCCMFLFMFFVLVCHVVFVFMPGCVVRCWVCWFMMGLRWGVFVSSWALRADVLFLLCGYFLFFFFGFLHQQTAVLPKKQQRGRGRTESSVIVRRKKEEHMTPPPPFLTPRGSA
jgi:hypothetical protein